MFNAFLLILFSFFANANDLIITADEMRYNNKTKKSVATGNARAEFKNKQYILKAHQFSMTQSAKEGQDYEVIDATGSVFLKTIDIEMNADHCLYKRESEKIVCTGHILLHDLKKGTKVAGHQAVFNVTQESYKLKGNCSTQTETILKLK